MKIWRRMWRTNKIGTMAFVYIIFTILVGLFADVLAPADPYKMSVMTNLKPPSLKHWSGTDRYGRDVLSRVIHGTRLTLKVGFLAVLGSTIIGTILGLSSVLNKILNTVLMRLVDVLMSLPGIFLALALVALMGPSEWTVIVALTVVYIPRTARIVNGRAIEIYETTFVDAARAVGAGYSRILLRHIFPSVFPALIVQITFVFATVILAETSLSFLGAGAPQPAPSWGNIMSEAKDYMRQAPWLTVAPGTIIFLFVMSLNLFGDLLREMLDPKMRGVQAVTGRAAE